MQINMVQRAVDAGRIERVLPDREAFDAALQKVVTSVAAICDFHGTWGMYPEPDDPVYAEEAAAITALRVLIYGEDDPV